MKTFLCEMLLALFIAAGGFGLIVAWDQGCLSTAPSSSSGGAP